jgi:uncharacterized RDD family membrane protein YckC
MSQTTAVAAGQRASFGRRLGAALIDGILLAIVNGVLTVAVGRNVATGVALAIGLAYYGYLEGSPSGQTLGKRALGIRVYDFGGGTGGIGFGRALIRYLGRILSTIPCLLGYLWMLWDKEKQTWHDKLANTVVVPANQYPVEKWPG